MSKTDDLKTFINRELLVAPASLMMAIIGFCLGLGGVAGLYADKPVGSGITLYIVLILFGIGCMLLAIPTYDIEIMYRHVMEEKRRVPSA